MLEAKNAKGKESNGPTDACSLLSFDTIEDWKCTKTAAKLAPVVDAKRKNKLAKVAEEKGKPAKVAEEKKKPAYELKTPRTINAKFKMCPKVVNAVSIIHL
jgi:hypothetical protein